MGEMGGERGECTQLENINSWLKCALEKEQFIRLKLKVIKCVKKDYVICS